MAVVVPAATHGAGVGGAAVPASTTTLVPACAVCGVAVSACASSLLAYYATLGVSLACFARAVWPDRVDAVLGPLGARARRGALLARADLWDDLRRLRNAARAHPATAPVCAGAEECARRARAAPAGRADGARRWAQAKWGQHKDAAGAAWFVLRLAGRVIRLAATVMLDAAWKEAKTQAPAVLGYLRGVIRAIRSPTSCNEEEAAGFVFRDIVSLVGIGFYLLFSTQLIFRFSTISGTQFYAACLAAACGLAMLLADWIDLPDDDEAGTTRVSADDADDTTQQREGAAGEARLDAELDVRESWQLLWVLIIIAFCFDAFLLHVTLGPRPTELALLALWNFEVLSDGRQVELTPDDGEGAEGSAGSVDGAVDKWRRGAMAVLAASGVKIFAIYLALDFYLAALSFLWLCVIADLLLVEEDSFSEMDESGDDEDREAGLAGIGEDITVGADEGADEARAEHYSNTSSSEDEEEAHTSSSEDEEEGCALNEHCDSSEEREQRREEPDGSSHGSTDEDDSWNLVEIDPEMPAKENCVANRKSSRLLFPWKSAA